MQDTLNNTRTQLTIRPANIQDVPLILDFIKALAAYEKLADQVTATEAILTKTLFGPNPKAEVILGFQQNKPVSFALFFHNFSTFLGKPGIYLEDLYVKPEARGQGIGKQMLQRLAQIALARDCGRLEWWVLDWNKPAINFYQSIGAVPMDEWTVHRMTGDVLCQLAQQKS